MGKVGEEAAASGGGSGGGCVHASPVPRLKLPPSHLFPAEATAARVDTPRYFAEEAPRTRVAQLKAEARGDFSHLKKSPTGLDGSTGRGK